MDSSAFPENLRTFNASPIPRGCKGWVSLWALVVMDSHRGVRICMGFLLEMVRSFNSICADVKSCWVLPCVMPLEWRNRSQLHYLTAYVGQKKTHLPCSILSACLNRIHQNSGSVHHIHQRWKFHWNLLSFFEKRSEKCMNTHTHTVPAPSRQGCFRILLQRRNPEICATLKLQLAELLRGKKGWLLSWVSSAENKSAMMTRSHFSISETIFSTATCVCLHASLKVSLLFNVPLHVASCLCWWRRETQKKDLRPVTGPESGVWETGHCPVVTRKTSSTRTFPNPQNNYLQRTCQWFDSINY